jgi:hypothetical protein
MQIIQNLIIIIVNFVSKLNILSLIYNLSSYSRRAAPSVSLIIELGRAAPLKSISLFFFR